VTVSKFFRCRVTWMGRWCPTAFISEGNYSRTAPWSGNRGLMRLAVRSCARIGHQSSEFLQRTALVFPHRFEEAVAPSCFKTVDLCRRAYRRRFRLICWRGRRSSRRRPFQQRSRQHRLACVPALSAVDNPVGPVCPRGRQRLDVTLLLCLRSCQRGNPDDASCDNQRCSFHRSTYAIC
jgi:hypothetical protein